MARQPKPPVGDSYCYVYTVMTATISFPGESPRCDLCPCLETYARNQCRLTGEYLINTAVQGYNCPLKYQETIDARESNEPGEFMEE